MLGFRTCVLAAASFAILAATATGQEAAPKVSYYKEIRAIFQERCQGCHQPAKKSGGYLMTNLADMTTGGESHEAGIVAGKPDESGIIRQITGKDGQPPAMPKGSDPLKPVQIERIRQWISEGAVDDTPATARDSIDMDHPPVYTSAPVITSVEYSPDGALLAVSGYHEVLIHSANGESLVARLVGMSERIESAVFSPDGKYLLVTGGSPARFGEVQIWDLVKKEITLSLVVTFDTLYGGSWSSDGAKVAFGCADNTVRVIEAATGKQIMYQGAHADWVLDTVFSTDNSHVVSVSRDMSMKLTEVATERFVDNVTSITPGALKGGLITVTRHPTKDELLIGGSDGEPKIYQMYRTQARQIGDDFNRITRFQAEKMPGRVFAAEYNRDGTRVVVASSNDGQGEVRVLNEADGKQISRFNTDFGGVYAVSFSKDGAQVAAGGFDGRVRIYDAQSGSLIKEFTPVPITPQPVAAASAGQ